MIVGLLAVLPLQASGDEALLKKLSLGSPSAPSSAAGELDCSNALVLDCGTSIDTSTVGSANQVDAYGCVEFVESGGEAVFQFTLEIQTEITLTLSGMQEDLDLFLLENCNPLDCIRSSTSVSTETIVACLSPGTWFVVVDGFNGSSSSFSLSLDCEPCVPCTPKVPNDTCAEAVVVPTLTSTWNTKGSTCCAADDYTDGSCTGFSSLGRDVIYRIDMAPGCSVDATLRDGSDGESLDLSMYLVTWCADPQGTCVAGSDQQVGGPGKFSYTSLDGGIHYLVVDSFGNDTCGDYELDVVLTNCTVVAVEQRGWQQVKSLYR
ncbi:MAG: PPC domain-containing protein [Candidatus Krumholzibacteriia bacterium]